MKCNRLISDEPVGLRQDLDARRLMANHHSGWLQLVRPLCSYQEPNAKERAHPDFFSVQLSTPLVTPRE